MSLNGKSDNSYVDFRVYQTDEIHDLGVDKIDFYAGNGIIQ